MLLPLKWLSLSQFYYCIRHIDTCSLTLRLPGTTATTEKFRIFFDAFFSFSAASLAKWLYMHIDFFVCRDDDDDGSDECRCTSFFFWWLNVHNETNFFFTAIERTKVEINVSERERMLRVYQRELKRCTHQFPAIPSNWHIRLELLEETRSKKKKRPMISNCSFA